MAALVALASPTLLAPAAVGAQDAARRPVSVEVGATTIAATGAGWSGPTGTLSLDWTRPDPRLPMRGALWLAPFAREGAAAEAAFDLARPFGGGRAPREVALRLGGLQLPGAPAFGTGALALRQHVVGAAFGAPAGLWLEGSAEGVQRGRPTQPAGALGVGLWHGIGRRAEGGRVVLSAAWSAVRLDSAVAARAVWQPPLLLLPGGPALPPRGVDAALLPDRWPLAFRALDVAASLERRGVRGELALRAGARRAPTLDQPPASRRTSWQPLATIDAVAWVTPTVGLTASAGERFAEPARGVPAVRWLAVGVRVAPGVSPLAGGASRGPGGRRVGPWGGAGGWILPSGPTGATGDAVDAAPASPVAGEPTPTDPAASTTRVLTRGVAALVVEPGARGERRLVVLATAATTVELRGDLTAWRPLALVADGAGRWRLPDGPDAPTATPGAHRLSVRVDGGAWRPPVNLPAVDDDFGSRVGLLVVP